MYPIDVVERKSTVAENGKYLRIVLQQSSGVNFTFVFSVPRIVFSVSSISNNQHRASVDPQFDLRS